MKLIENKNGVLKMYCDTCNNPFAKDYHNIMMIWDYEGNVRFIHNDGNLGCDNKKKYPLSRHFEQWIAEVQKKELAGRKRRHQISIKELNDD
tara:strand:- start:2299 stop:2574 length:276 start_codon:yes stop_codon:yes gene_type:complete